jgi:hypothetical protein
MDHEITVLLPIGKSGSRWDMLGIKCKGRWDIRNNVIRISPIVPLIWEVNRSHQGCCFYDNRTTVTHDPFSDQGFIVNRFVMH